MKIFDIDKKALLIGLKKIAVATKNTSVLSESVMFTATAENLTLTATCADLSAKVVIDQPNPDFCKTKENFYHCATDKTFLVSCPLVETIVSSLTGDDIIFATEGKKIIISDGNSKFTVNTMNVEDFPNVDFSTDAPGFMIKTEVLKEIIERTVPLINPKETRSVLTGVNFSYSGGELKAYSTDSYKMIRFTKLVSLNAENKVDDLVDFNVTIPMTALTAILKHMSDNEDYIEVYLDTNATVFETRNLIIKTPMLTGAYPSIDRLFLKPEDCSTHIEFDRKTLASVVKRASLFKAAGSKQPIITLRISEDRVEFSANAEEVGNFYESINAEVSSTGEMVEEINFTTDYLTTLLNSFTGEKVSMHFATSLKPMVMYDPDDDAIAGLLCPVKTYA